jgi:phage-related tail fiber protein
MANTIRVKRTTTSNRPTTLANAELAFIEGSQILVCGLGSAGAGGSATSIIDIGGIGAFLGLSSGLTQTAAGTYNFSGTLTAVTRDSSDNSTKVATTAFVKSLGYVTGNQSITVTGDVTGSGTTSITASIANDAVTNAKLANMATATIKGRATAGTGDPEDLSASDVKTLLAIVHTDLSDFDTGVQQNRLDQMAAPTASVSLNSQLITGLAAPVSATDAANKAYVDASRSGLDVKDSVRAATTGDITLSGEQTIDGVAVVAGDRVLVKNQSTGSANGIYVAAAGAWSRATDADTSAEVTAGMFAFVAEGTVNADSGWVLSTNDTITLGTTSLTFSQFSGAGQITAGAGLTKSGNTLDVVTADSGRIVVNSDSIDLAVSGVTASTYKSVTVDTYGRVTAGTNPTTLGGYGITDAQPVDATLTALAGVTVAADNLIYATGADAFTVTTFTAFGRSILDDVDAAAGRTTLGLGTMATQAASGVAITGGTISGIDLDGGSY